MDDRNYRVIILVKHGLYAPFIDLAREAQGQTWLDQEIPNEIKIIHYYGIPGGRTLQFLDKVHEEIRWKNRTSKILLGFWDFITTLPLLLWIPRVTSASNLSPDWEEYQCRVMDTILTLRWKQLAIYKHVLDQFQFDYMYETNSSSYIDIENLLKLTKSLSNSPLYAGNVLSGKFVSGANRFFDRGALKLLIRRRILWNPIHLEDVAIGSFMHKQGVPITECSSISLSSLRDLEVISNTKLISEHHFRTKSYAHGKRLDAEIMKSLHERITKLRFDGLTRG